jgi:transcription termination factor NusB
MNNNENKNEHPFKHRHRSRELALQTLYACEVGLTTEWKSMLDQIENQVHCLKKLKNMLGI